MFHTLSTSNSHKQGRSSLPFAAHERNSSFLYKNGAKFFASGWFLCADCNMQIRLIDDPFHRRMTGRNDSIFFLLFLYFCSFLFVFVVFVFIWMCSSYQAERRKRQWRGRQPTDDADGVESGLMVKREAGSGGQRQRRR